MIFDTDVLIWFLRGDQNAARLIAARPDRAISIVTLMELLQGARSRSEIRLIRSFLQEQAFQVLPLNEPISHLAATLVEDFTLSHGLQVADALIAATARHALRVLATGNARHFRPIPSLELHSFRPSRS